VKQAPKRYPGVLNKSLTRPKIPITIHRIGNKSFKFAPNLIGAMKALKINPIAISRLIKILSISKNNLCPIIF